MADVDCDARVRCFVDEMTRTMLYRVARAVELAVDPAMRRDALIERVAVLPLSTLRVGLARLSEPDLRTLCAQFGYSVTGAAPVLVDRLVAAIADPRARIWRWRPFDAARRFAQALELHAQKDWFRYTRGLLPDKEPRPDDIPVAPALVYRKYGWTSWGDFLGTGNPARHLIRYRPFEQARDYARSLGLISADEWKTLCIKRIGNRRVLPPDIPSAPALVYAGNGWVSFGDWLGTGSVSAWETVFQPYEEARRFVQSLQITTEPAWRAYCRGELRPETPRPPSIPTNPQKVYDGAGWVSWGEFFGTGSIACYKRTFRSYESAAAHVREQGLRDSREWRRWCRAGKRPPDIPVAPDRTYRGRGWISWPAFFGVSAAGRESPDEAVG